ncbi:MAG: hypothetical protein K6G52_05900, partial [Treponemataceae bacterium]|nr:hypothetical protein [Treponemataceae bacterium]
MKKFVSKIKFLSILTFSALFIFTSCEDLAMPSKVEIIASPSYTVPAGTIDSVTDRLDELMSGDALTNLLGDNISIYKYMNSSTD